MTQKGEVYTAGIGRSEDDDDKADRRREIETPGLVRDSI
jgi:hypothetical protein